MQWMESFVCLCKDAKDVSRRPYAQGMTMHLYYVHHSFWEIHRFEYHVMNALIGYLYSSVGQGAAG